MRTQLLDRYQNDHCLTRNAIVRARINDDLKSEVQNILGHLGLTISEAISLYMSQIKLKKGIPFEVNIPNKETVRAIKEARAGIGVVVCKNAQDMYKKLGI